MTEGFPRRERRPRRRRVAARLAYDGSGFRGFQRQPGVRTVEGALVEALEACGYGGGMGFASRTDAGVHALGQVIAFRVPEQATDEEVRAALSDRLPKDIRIDALVPAPRSFHPRWSSTGKRYVYRLDAVPNSDALLEALEELRTAPSLDGFTAAGAPPKPAPPLTSLVLEQAPEQTSLVFEGPGFKRYAIRHMVGALVAQATGEFPPGSCARIALEPPPYRGPRAAPGGLTLKEVFYPQELDPFAQRKRCASSD